MTIVHDLWSIYKKNVVPEDASQVQLKETRQAFFAGAWAIFSTLPELLEEGEDATERDMRVMESIALELHEFNEKTMAGKT